MVPLETVFFFASFLLGVAGIRLVAKRNQAKGLLGPDINKPGERKIPESAGIALLLPIWACALSYYLWAHDPAAVAWAAMVSLFSIVGFLDDILPKFQTQTRKWHSRAIFIAIISLAFSGLFFWNNPLNWLLAALFLAGVASFENTFAGLNGWEVGSGFILSVFFGLLLIGFTHFALAAALGGSILALLAFNAYPAKAFPGDSGTLLIGSGLAGLLIWTGSIWLMVIAFLFLVPHFVDFGAKMLSNPRDPSQRKVRPYQLLAGGKLGMPKGSRKYDFAKILIKIFGPMGERRIVFLIWVLVVLNCSVVYLLLAP